MLLDLNMEGFVLYVPNTRVQRNSYVPYVPGTRVQRDSCVPYVSGTRVKRGCMPYVPGRRVKEVLCYMSLAQGFMKAYRVCWCGSRKRKFLMEACQYVR